MSCPTRHIIYDDQINRILRLKEYTVGGMDSVRFGITWGEKRPKRESASFDKSHPLYKSISQSDYDNMVGWDEFDGKITIVEVRLDGTIIFHAERDIAIPEQEWRSDLGVLESALEQSYNSSRTRIYKGNFYSYIQDTSD